MLRQAQHERGAGTGFGRFVGALWLLLVALLIAAPAAAQDFPKFTGLVVDAANVLPPATRDDLTRKLEALQHDTHRQLVVATIPSLGDEPIADYGYKLGRNWGVGLRDVNNGIILFVAPNEPAGHRGPRIEVGRGLEPIVTDALSDSIIRNQMMPRLHAKSPDLPGAMEAGTDALIRQLRASPDEAKTRGDAAIAEFNKVHQRAGGGGGGVPLGLIFWLVVMGFVAASWLRRGRGDVYHRGGNWPIMLWGLADALGSSRGGGGGSWSDGGGSSGGGNDGSWGGGGFTGGGGGDFGGGGASGDW